MSMPGGENVLGGFFVLIYVVVGIFFMGYHMDYQITEPNRVFKTIKLNSVFRRLFLFRNKDKVQIVALIPQIWAYITMVMGIFFNIIVFIILDINSTKIFKIYNNLLLVQGLTSMIYVFICMGTDKLLNKKK